MDILIRTILFSSKTATEEAGECGEYGEYGECGRFNHQLSTTSCQPSTFNCQLSTVNIKNVLTMMATAISIKETLPLILEW
ncbi:MAG: hypothetical protein QNJ36_20510 [Calothrix sp. MO_167.B42]|nr:hypothetical protein [Calothrix sp. MO_167.B42]